MSNNSKLKLIVNSRWALVLVSVAVTLLLVSVLSSGDDRGRAAARERDSSPAKFGLEPSSVPTILAAKAQTWSCSMHPHIHKDGPGQCPVCGMDLIKVPSFGADEDAGTRRLRVTENQRALMKIATVPAERRYPTASLRLAGKVAYDETALSYITAWVPGRIDRLFVDYTGLSVNKGDHMVELYSPELYSAQEELLQALRGMRELSKSGLGSLRESARGTVNSARDKLRLAGLTAEQIKAIETSGKPQERVTIYSPSSGVVIDKNAQEGMYVETGSRVFTIADLSSVWVELDAYESDLQWLRAGQSVSFASEAFPGDQFQGRIAFIDPVLDSATRTASVRVNVDNSDERLKPGMFIRARVSARLALGGEVVDEYLDGKWVSPMHPEHVSDKPGACPVCGMDMVKTESLVATIRANSGADTERMPPIVIPATAALLTGKRAVVYVEDVDAEVPTYEGREVVLGARAGADYIVASGLAEGELVVVSGNFKIDSALQIQAKPSMMNPLSESVEGARGSTAQGHNHDGH